MQKPPSPAPSPPSSPPSSPSAEDEAYPIRILADGTWLHEGQPIRRLPLVRLFASALTRDAAGDYWLITPAERGRIRVDDVPFLLTHLSAEGEGKGQQLTFTTNLGETVVLSATHPLEMRDYGDAARGSAEGKVSYIRLHENLWARAARPVFYEICALAAEGSDGRIGVWSSGCFFPID